MPSLVGRWIPVPSGKDIPPAAHREPVDDRVAERDRLELKLSHRVDQGAPSPAELSWGS
jgi:hypothetical protein